MHMALFLCGMGAKKLRKFMFWIQNPDPESESSAFDVESYDTDYKLNPESKFII